MSFAVQFVRNSRLAQDHPSRPSSADAPTHVSRNAAPPLSPSVLGAELLDEFVYGVAGFVHASINSRSDGKGTIERPTFGATRSRRDASFSLAVLFSSLAVNDLIVTSCQTERPSFRVQRVLAQMEHNYFNVRLNNLMISSKTSSAARSSTLIFTSSIYFIEPDRDCIRVMRDENTGKELDTIITSMGRGLYLAFSCPDISSSAPSAYASLTANALRSSLPEPTDTVTTQRIRPSLSIGHRPPLVSYNAKLGASQSPNTRSLGASPRPSLQRLLARPPRELTSIIGDAIESIATSLNSLNPTLTRSQIRNSSSFTDSMGFNWYQRSLVLGDTGARLAIIRIRKLWIHGRAFKPKSQ
ncbi:hypothetical protein BKA93DRAFT_826813 [Sparassis latifolia]